jgi:gluconate 2-dehydrogenase
MLLQMGEIQMKPKVFLANRVPKEVEDYIAEHCDYRKWDSEEKIPREKLLSELADVSGLLISGAKIDQELLDAAPNLRIVSNISVGYNNMDLVAMKNRKVMGTNTPSVLDNTVADLVFGLILSAARRITELDRLVKEGGWQPGSDKSLFGMDVHHSKLGIIGMGRIGEAIARRAKWGFDMEVLYYNRSRNVEAESSLGAKYCDLQELLQVADFVVLMIPLTADTIGFIGREQFALMKNTAFFINASRGQTVDENALIEALAKGVIRGAGLDVYEQEPVAWDNPLLKMPNVVTLPHIGSATEQTRNDMALLAAQNLVKAVSGEAPSNLISELRVE